VLVLDDRLKSTLNSFHDMGNAVLKEFTKVALDFTSAGEDRSIFGRAASKLGKEEIEVENAIEGLCVLFAENAKMSVLDDDFVECLSDTTLDEDAKNLLLQAYQVQKDTLRDRLSLFSLSLPSYHTLRWRMDVQVASKNMKGQSDPLFSLQLQLSDEKGKVVAHSLCSDVTNLKAVTSSLDEALKSARGPHMKRIQRFMS